MVGIAVAWIVGLFLTGFVGHVACKAFLDWLRARVGLPEKTWQPLLTTVTGITERTFFASLVAIQPSAIIATAMVAWVGLKLAANWNHPDQKIDQRRVWAMTALIGGLVSMLIAFFGGLFIQWLSGRLE